MSLRVRLTVNGKDIDVLTITNQGPPDGEYDVGDGPGGDGIRRYRYDRFDGSTGTVDHARRDGAHALVAKVLEQITARDST